MVVLKSTGKSFQDPYIYLGSGGTAYMYYRLYKYALRTEQPDQASDYLGKAMAAWQVSNHILIQQAVGGQGQESVPSFFFGNVGI